MTEKQKKGKFPQLTDGEVHMICDAIQRYVDEYNTLGLAQPEVLKAVYNAFRTEVAKRGPLTD